MQNNVTVPTGVDELTADWLCEALGVSSVTWLAPPEQIGQDYGFASQIFRIRLSGRSLVAKLWNVEQVGQDEVLFYQTFSNLNCRIPTCYFAATDQKQRRAVLLLEDVSGGVQGNVLKPLSKDQAIGVAASLAHLHAQWTNSPTLAETTWLKNISSWEPAPGWIESRRKRFLSRFPTSLNLNSAKMIEQLEQLVDITNIRVKSQPSTLLHGDFHLDNLLFDAENAPVILDWARPVLGPPVLNLAVLLFEMAPLQYFDLLLASYSEQYNQLAEHPLNKDDLQHALGGALIRRFSQLTCGIALWEPTKPRGGQIIEHGIKQANNMIDFGLKRDLW